MALERSTTSRLSKPVLQWNSEGWREWGACQGSDADLFFPTGSTGDANDRIESAKAVCATCPVKDPCLQYAFETNQEAGVWGGTDEAERRRLRRHWRTGRSKMKATT